MATKMNGNGKTGAVALQGGFNVAKYRTGVANVAKRPAAGGRAGFLKMDKDDHGRWKFGQGDTPVGEDDELYVDPDGMVYGWQCWADTDLGVPAAVLGSIVVPTDQPLPPKPDTVPENGREWAEMRGLSMVLNGQPLIYTTTSMGGLDAVAAYMAEFAAQLDVDETKLIGVIKLSSDWYKNKKHGGRTYVPIFTVQRWVSALPKEATTPAKAPAKGPAKVPAKGPVKTPPPPKTPLRRDSRAV